MCNCEVKRDLKVEWENDNFPAALVAEIKSNLSLTNDGRVSYKISTNFAFDALFGKIVHSFNLDHDVLYNEFKKSITDTFKKNRLSRPDDVLQAFKARCEAVMLKSFKLTESNLDIQLAKIRSSPFQEHLNKSLTSYINALDHKDQEFRFMKLWSVLEQVVKTDESTTLKKRISFLYEDRETHKAMIESLRNPFFL